MDNHAGWACSFVFVRIHSTDSCDASSFRHRHRRMANYLWCESTFLINEVMLSTFLVPNQVQPKTGWRQRLRTLWLVGSYRVNRTSCPHFGHLDRVELCGFDALCRFFVFLGASVSFHQELEILSWIFCYLYEGTKVKHDKDASVLVGSFETLGLCKCR